MKRRLPAIVVALAVILTVPRWAQQVFETSTKQRKSAWEVVSPG
jgi:hypothetical protein